MLGSNEQHAGFWEAPPLCLEVDKLLKTLSTVHIYFTTWHCLKHPSVLCVKHTEKQYIYFSIGDVDLI